MSKLTIGEYLSGMNAYRSTLETNLEYFWHDLFKKTSNSNLYRDQIIIENQTSRQILFKGINLIIQSAAKIVFCERSPLLEIDFYYSDAEVKHSVLKVYFDTTGETYFGALGEFERADTRGTDMPSAFFSKLITTASEKGAITVV